MNNDTQVDQSNGQVYGENDDPQVTETSEVSLNVGKASRTINVVSFGLVEGNIHAFRRTTQYSVDLCFNERLLQKALVYNVIAEASVMPTGGDYPSYPLWDTLHINNEDESFPAEGSPYWDRISTLSFRPGSKSGKKLPRVTRVSKIASLLQEIQDIQISLHSAMLRLKTLKDPSPSPHGDTSEMTFGSSVEIAEQQKVAEGLHAKLETKRAALSAQLNAINEHFIKPEDTGWIVSLPDVIYDITRLNQYELAFDDEPSVDDETE